MEKGQMRVEANISLDMGTKVEVKNINSFKAVHDAIEYELERQKETLEGGGKIHQETRGWNESKARTESQRSKESAHDYRYFPEPDLPPLDPTKLNLEEIKGEIPELPESKRHRFVEEFGFSLGEVEPIILDKAISEYFEEAASELESINPETQYGTLYNYFTSDLWGLMKEKAVSVSDLKIKPDAFANFVSMIDKGVLSSRLAKDLLKKMFETGEDPETLKREGGMDLMSGEAELMVFIEEAIAKNPNAVADYKKGKKESLQFLVGQVMGKTKGRANPQTLRELLTKRLN
jgi:aspartyl-tRNA(Asn)/glutamyl-tRNA(Gln) amidotransferase subunit B